MFRNGQLWMIDNKGVQDCKLWVDIIISNIYLPRLVIFVMKNVTVIIISNILHTKHDFFSSLRKVRDIKGFWCLAVSIVPGFLSPMEDAGCVKIGGYFEERSICHFRRQREQKETFLSSNKQAKLKQTFRENPWEYQKFRNITRKDSGAFGAARQTRRLKRLLYVTQVLCIIDFFNNFVM